MFSIYIIIPFIAMIGIIIYCNSRFFDTTKIIHVLYIILESMMMGGISYFLFFFGFMTTYQEVVVPLLISISSGLLLYVITKHQYDDFYIHWKIVGNSLLTFLKIGLPLYLFLTIFRFQPMWIQIGLSIGITAILFAISLLLKTPLAKLIRFIDHYIFSETHYAVGISIVVTGIALIFLFNVPTFQINDALNTDNHQRYLDFYQELPRDIDVNFEQDDMTQIELPYNNGIVDFYLDDNILYVLTSPTSGTYDDGHILVYNISNNTMLQEFTLNRNTASVNDDFEEHQQYFIFPYNDDILMNTTSGVYLVNTMSITKITSDNSIILDHFYLDNNLLFVKQTTNQYEFYTYDGAWTLVSTLDNSQYAFTVYGETLLLQDTSGYYITDTNGTKGANITYKDETLIDSMVISYDTETIIGDQSILVGNELYTTDNNYAIRVYQVNDVTSDNSYDPVKYNRLHRIDRFFVFNQLSRTQTAQIRYDDGINYIVMNTRNHTSILTLYSLEYKDVDINTPFYSHYSFTTLLFVIAGVLTPYWNTDTSYTYVDFVSITKKKDGAK